MTSDFKDLVSVLTAADEQIRTQREMIAKQVGTIREYQEKNLELVNRVAELRSIIAGLRRELRECREQ